MFVYNSIVHRFRLKQSKDATLTHTVNNNHTITHNHPPSFPSLARPTLHWTHHTAGHTAYTGEGKVQTNQQCPAPYQPGLDPMLRMQCRAGAQWNSLFVYEVNKCICWHLLLQLVTYLRLFPSPAHGAIWNMISDSVCGLVNTATCHQCAIIMPKLAINMPI